MDDHKLIIIYNWPWGQFFCLDRIGWLSWLHLYLPFKHDRIRDSLIEEGQVVTLEKTVYMNQLLSYYGTLLTDKQASVMQAYYEADYSLAEIAENLQISRQAVHDIIRRSEEALNHYENQLQLKKKSDQRWQALEDLTQLLQGHEQALHLVHQLIELEQ